MEAKPALSCCANEEDIESIILNAIYKSHIFRINFLDYFHGYDNYLA
jgi:hypothetical protein